MFVLSRGSMAVTVSVTPAPSNYWNTCLADTTFCVRHNLTFSPNHKHPVHTLYPSQISAGSNDLYKKVKLQNLPSPYYFSWELSFPHKSVRILWHLVHSSFLCRTPIEFDKQMRSGIHQEPHVLWCSSPVGVSLVWHPTWFLHDFIRNHRVCLHI